MQVKVHVEEKNAEYDQFAASLTRIDELKNLSKSEDSDTLAFDNPDYKTDQMSDALNNLSENPTNLDKV